MARILPTALPALPSRAALLDDHVRGAREELARAGASLGLCAVFGAALGLRDGAASIALHGALVPLAPFVAFALGTPALAILLALGDAPLGGAAVLAVARRSLAAIGVALAGLAAPTALLVLTAEESAAAAAAARVALCAAGAFGLRSLARDVSAALAGAPPKARAVATAATFGFAVFASVTMARAWASLPLLGTGGTP